MGTERIPEYALRIGTLFFGIFTGFLGWVLLDMITEHDKKKKEYKSWKAKRARKQFLSEL